MVNGARFRKAVYERLDPGRIQAMETRQPIYRTFRFAGAAINLGAITSRDDSGFAHRFAVNQITQCLIEAGGFERDLLPDIHRRRIVVDPEGK